MYYLVKGQNAVVETGLERIILCENEGAVAWHKVPLGHIQWSRPVLAGKVFGDLQLQVQSFIQICFAVDGKK